ncbi:UNVERIFIED_CONTAM: hypothetical protein K2H54_025610 [Gekko kuhli]
MKIQSVPPPQGWGTIQNCHFLTCISELLRPLRHLPLAVPVLEVSFHRHCPVRSHMGTAQAHRQPPEDFLASLLTEQEEPLSTGAIGAVFPPSGHVLQGWSLH